MTPPTPAAAGRSRGIGWLLPGALLLIALVGPLLIPGQVLTEGDLPFFHLPLRHSLAALANIGELPTWNPWLHGGQPILSNPNYAAFYPPTWLAFLSPAYSLQLLLVLHAALAYAGAWRLVRRLGGSPPAAALAAVGFAAAPWFLSLGDTINLYCGISWIPWTLAGGVGALTADDERSSRRQAVLCAATLALALLAGEPVAPLLGALGLAALTLFARASFGTKARVLGLVAILALGLAAVQFLPTAVRLAESPRATGLAAGESTVWSSPPARLVELAFPYFWGDPQRDEEGLYFGWTLHDRRYPYVESLYLGLPLLILGLAGFVVPGVPLRAGWAAMAVMGLVLGLGRHTPVFAITTAVPPFSWIRYPEKFLLLSVVALVFSGALAVDRMVMRPLAETKRLFRVALSLGIAILSAAIAIAGWWWLNPGTTDRFLREKGLLDPESPMGEGARMFLHSEALLGLLAALLFLVALGFARRRPRTFAVSILGLTLLQFVHYGQGRNPTLAAGDALAPPPLAQEILAAGPGRLFTDVGLHPDPDVHPRVGAPGFYQVLGKTSRLDPYVGVLWGIPYVFHDDYDLMFTRWNRHAQEVFLRAWPAPRSSREILEAWGVRHLLAVADPEQRALAYRRTGRIAPPARYSGLEPLPLVRSLRRLDFVPVEEAWRDLEARSFSSRNTDTCLGTTREELRVSEPARVEPVRIGGSSFEIDLEPTNEGALVVVATTFDRGWRGYLPSGEPVPLCPTALGQIAFETLPSARRVELRHRVPWTGSGAVVSLATLAMGLWLGWRRS